jgi:Fur family peroxide stress response transcriptional regulator
MDISNQNLKEKIKGAGLKPTAQRIVILKEILSRKDHPSADIIHQSLKEEYPTLSINTVHMNLESFLKKGIISKVNYLHESARFDGDIKSHHHFACLCCKKIIDIHDLKIPEITMSEKLKVSKIFFQQLQFNGICKECED